MHRHEGHDKADRGLQRPWGRQTDRQMNTDRQLHKCSYKHRQIIHCRLRQTGKQAGRQAGRQAERQRDRQTDKLIASRRWHYRRESVGHLCRRCIGSGI